MPHMHRPKSVDYVYLYMTCTYMTGRLEYVFMYGCMYMYTYMYMCMYKQVHMYIHRWCISYFNSGESEGFFLNWITSTYIYVWRDAQTASAHETFEDFQDPAASLGTGPSYLWKRLSRFPLFDWQLCKPSLTRAYCERYDSPRKATKEQKGLTGASRDIIVRICGMNQAGGGWMVWWFVTYLEAPFLFYFILFFIFSQGPPPPFLYYYQLKKKKKKNGRFRSKDSLAEK